MKDFLFAALPFLIIGVCVAIIMVHYKTKDSEKKENHLVEGMCIGMCLGVAVSTVLQQWSFIFVSTNEMETLLTL